jgi:hypothetical protein
MNYATQNDGSRWYESNKNDLYQDVSAYLKALDKEQSYRTSDNLRFAKLYGNYSILGLDAYSYTRVESSANITHRVTLNIVQSLIDTVVSKITKNKPKPTFLTDGGNWSLKRRAKKLTKFIEGVFSYTDFYDKAAMSFLDACIFGTGCIKIFEKDGNISCERVFIQEIKVDDIEAYYSKPRQIHQVKYVHKDVLKKLFPSHELQIDNAASSQDEFSTSAAYVNKKHMVQVTESWRLPSVSGANDGRRAITISNATLLEEEYTKDYFPFVFFRWGRRPVGFFGQGLAEQLQGLQLEINKILRTIQVSMHLVSIPKILVEASSKIVTSHLNNKIGGIIKYAGKKPEYSPLGGIPTELFSHLDRLYTRAYEISGISQLSSQSLKPAGLDSGKALREYSDIETERFLSVGKAYEKCFMDAADIMIDIARDLYAKDKDFKVNVKGRRFIETIKWSEVNMDKDAYMMDVFPTSALSSTPSGRLADIQELVAAGFIDQQAGMQLLDFPDLEGSMNMLNADSNNLERLLEDMMDKGKYFPPEPFQNLENALRKTQQAYLMYRNEGAPEERLELLRRFMEDIQGLQMKAVEQEQKQQMQAQLAAQQELEQQQPTTEPDLALETGSEEMFTNETAQVQQDQELLDQGILPSDEELME